MSTDDPNHKPVNWAQAFSETRRDFLLHTGLILNTVAGALVGIPVIGFIISSMFKNQAPSWISLGPLTQFPIGETRMAAFTNPGTTPTDGTTSHIACWVRRLEEKEFKVFAVNCTHLGCPVRWFEESELFLCPCHGGAFYADGNRAAGPPPRGLYEYQVRVENNELKILGGVQPTLENSIYKG
jgi:menaquinol-cytochrome c reductase iron-sulfur subunit